MAILNKNIHLMNINHNFVAALKFVLEMKNPKTSKNPKKHV